MDNQLKKYDPNLQQACCIRLVLIAGKNGTRFELPHLKNCKDGLWAILPKMPHETLTNACHVEMTCPDGKTVTQCMATCEPTILGNCKAFETNRFLIMQEEDVVTVLIRLPRITFTKEIELQQALSRKRMVRSQKRRIKRKGKRLLQNLEHELTTAKAEMATCKQQKLLATMVDLTPATLALFPLLNRPEVLYGGSLLKHLKRQGKLAHFMLDSVYHEVVDLEAFKRLPLPMCY